MKKSLLYLLIISTFTACSVNTPAKAPKKVYIYDSVTEIKIENSIENILKQLMTSDIQQKYEYIFVEKFNATENNYSLKFENYLSKVINTQLNKRGFKTNNIKKVTLTVSYAPFGDKGILINCFLMDFNSRKIISSAKGIVYMNSCRTLNINCNQNNHSRTEQKIINNQKRIIGLVDANCKENCNKKQNIEENIEKKEIVEEIKVDYN